MAGPLIRVVVVTYSPGATLSVFLDSLALATERSYEVVIADNGPMDVRVDRAVEAATGRHEVVLVRTGGNLGYGGGANVGATGLTADWLVVANPDVVWEPGALDVLVDAGERWPAAGAFGPAIRTTEGALYPSARALPSIGRGIGHALCGWWWPANPWTAAYRQETGAPSEGPAGWLSGSCLLIRRTAWQEVGGFDPTYFMYFEDVDLGARLAAAGFASLYVPSAVVTHTGGHATSKVAGRMLQAHHDSAYRYLARRYPGLPYAPLRLVLRGGLWLRYQLSKRSRRVAEGAAPTRSADVLEP